MKYKHIPDKQGLYDPRFEHDSCGVGFVCNIKGVRSNSVIKQGLEALRNLSHRGATGADPKTGDGAGLLIQIPHEFFIKALAGSGIELPQAGDYGTGLVFLPKDEGQRQKCKDIFAKVIEAERMKLLCWRRVPTDNSDIGVAARDTEPVIEQPFIEKGRNITNVFDFERRLYAARKRIETAVRSSGMKEARSFYITNISSRTISYKGLLIPAQVENYFLDLKDSEMKSAIALVHSRYSTNTFPTWDLAQPFRFLAHNGEINTLRGNINWMRAREGLLGNKLFGKNLKKILPVIVPGGSDSASIDNAFELLVLSGRGMAHAMMMLIPAAWEQDRSMDSSLKDFYKYHACFMEPWDGPAAIAFTDGTRVGACLDRNGLRPARYIVTRDGTAVMASEVGVLDIPAENILVSGKLEPGKIFYIDTQLGRIIGDKELKRDIATSNPYGPWLKKYIVELEDVACRKEKEERPIDTLTALKAFGYTREDMNVLIKPMAENGAEPIGSMGNDTPHAVLTDRPQLLFTYFKQLFAQVTNPPIDPIREEIVMSLDTYLGPEKNILEETPSHCHKLRVGHPVLSVEECEKIKNIHTGGFRTKIIKILFDVKRDKDVKKTLKKICDEAASAIKDGYTFIVLTDRGMDAKLAPMPSLLAAGAVHHHLVRKALRTRVSIIVESAEPREVHHFALLFGYGADCICPYLAYEAVKKLVDEKDLEIDHDKAIANYRKAVNKGILKVLSKMGISKLQSYRGAQIFEALGIGQDVIEMCFAGTVSRIGGIGFDMIQKEAVERHKRAYGEKEPRTTYLDTGGLYQWKKDGEFRLWNPESVSALQDSVWTANYEKYKEFARLINDQALHTTTLRSLLEIVKQKPVPIEEVEPVEDIVKRFATGAMSFGSISAEAHETMAIAMNRLAGRSNSGEGGEDPARFLPMPNGDSKRSSVKQVASGRFGVTANYLVNADELQIKIAQGAKPGEGGQLPGHKVSASIAKIRYTTPGVTLISPPPHHDIYSIEDLAQLIFDLKNANPNARVSVKLVSEIGVGTVAAGVAKGHADMILISGGDGGTGASPLSSIKHAGLPWELGLAETHQTLVLNDLRDRVRLQTDGQMRTGRDVAIAALLGAEEFGFATAALVIMGCVMLRHCHLNNCSVGVATQDEVLRQRFRGKPEHIVQYFRFVAQELREIMASLGIKKIDEMVGRTDFLRLNKDIVPQKASRIDFSNILYKPKISEGINTHFTGLRNNRIGAVLDTKLIELAREALAKGAAVKMELPITNRDRTTGAMLSGELCKRYGESGLNTDTIHCAFRGVAGQSFGAFLAKGITFELEGMANDYVGKGISGGHLIIYPDRNARYAPEENIIIGNTTFYGAINGEAYIRGRAGERFCVRNSGLNAVVEGVGDHGCEYMTGGRIVILGATGRNFGAGMSGGIAYVYDPRNMFKPKCNLEMVELEKVSEDDVQTISNLLSNHHRLTKSPIAKKILDNYEHEMKNFVKVMPVEYKRIIEKKEIRKKPELVEVSDG